jgi:hypothetical protein
MSEDIRKMIDKVKNFKQFVNETVNEPKFAYHVTRRKNLNSIKKKGLEPRIPIDYGTDGDVKGVYLFKTIEDTQNALYNWLGERIEEWEEENNKEYDEVVLKINISGLEEHLIDSAEYEWTCLVNIVPSRIVDLIEM